MDVAGIPIDHNWVAIVAGIALWTLSLIAIYEGTRRLIAGEQTRLKAGLLLAVGAAFCGIAVVDTASRDREFRKALDVLDRSRGILDNQGKSAREKAQIAFWRTGEIIKYIDEAGEPHDYSPSSSDVRFREAHAAMRGMLLVSLAKGPLTLATLIGTPTLLGLFAIALGLRSRRRVANSPLDSEPAQAPRDSPKGGSEKRSERPAAAPSSGPVRVVQRAAQAQDRAAR